MVAVLPDIYTESSDCVGILRTLGLADHAEELDRALCGSTSGEILALTGAAIQRILRERRKDLPPEVRDRLKRLRKAVDRALRPPWSW